jgi:flagellar hook assembly protein FlgD
MKQLVLIFSFTFIFFQVMGLSAQSFSWQADTTSMFVSPGFATHIFETFVQNNTANEIRIRVARINNQLPTDWTSSLCVGLCYPPNVDTLEMTVPASGQEALELNVQVNNNLQSVANITLKLENLANTSEAITKDFTVSTQPAGLSNRQQSLSGQFQLQSNYPNPFNPSTTIPFEIGMNSRGTTSLAIYNILGQRVRLLFDKFLQPGAYEITWNGQDDRGNPVTSGLYFYQLRSGNNTLIGKMVMMK